jgi:hypothetical protein
MLKIQVYLSKELLVMERGWIVRSIVINFLTQVRI